MVPVLAKSGASSTSSRPPWPTAATLGAACDGFRQLAVLADDAQASRPLGHQHASVGEELQTPRVLEPLGDALDLDPGRLCRRRGVGDDGGGRAGCAKPSGQSPSNRSNSLEH